MKADALDAILREASLATSAALELADELESIIERSLPANASRALVGHLRRVVVRLRGIAQVLQSELDHQIPEVDVVRPLVRALRAAGRLAAASVVFICGALATGAVEGLGDDAQGLLLGRAEQIEISCQLVGDVEVSGSEAESIARRTELSSLLSALESSDVVAFNQHLAFILRFEPLFRTAIIEVMADQYGDDWMTREDVAPLLRDLDGSTLRLSSLRGLTDAAIRLAETHSDAPPIIRVFPEMARDLIDLRNRYAHGQTQDENWLRGFREDSGANRLRSMWLLYEQLESFDR